jgi:glycosyltransferase involved in cell wall biosynthesis
LEGAVVHREGNAPAVSVVVCTHTDRRLGLLKECVDSLAANTRPPLETIVVVDSNPELLARLAGMLPAHVTLIASEGRGVSQARNTGIAIARGDLVAFIDDDAIAEPTWLERIAAPFADPRVAAAGGRILPRWERPNRVLPEELLWVVGSTYAGHPVVSQPISRPIACNMVARRDVLVQLGGFPKEFGPSGPTPKSHSNEEIALAVGLRARYGQDSIWYVPDAVVHHFVPADRGTWGYLWHRCRAEGVSKADVRLRYGSSAMDFDRSYARKTLLPAITRYARNAVLRREPGAGAKAVAGAGGLLVTAVAYVTRLTTGRLATVVQPNRTGARV